MPDDPVYPFEDERDFADAERGFIAALKPGVVRNAVGEVVWDNDSYAPQPSWMLMRGARSPWLR
jgi:alkyl sulfatase BDS1-like metallo-beta-lactamase superfamily hydrolase